MNSKTGTASLFYLQSTSVPARDLRPRQRPPSRDSVRAPLRAVVCCILWLSSVVESTCNRRLRWTANDSYGTP